MPDAISNTSPLLYLYRIDVFDWLPELFNIMVNRLGQKGMWLTDDIRRRILTLAGETAG